MLLATPPLPGSCGQHKAAAGWFPGLLSAKEDLELPKVGGTCNWQLNTFTCYSLRSPARLWSVLLLLVLSRTNLHSWKAAEIFAKAWALVTRWQERNYKRFGKRRNVGLAFQDLVLSTTSTWIHLLLHSALEIPAEHAASLGQHAGSEMIRKYFLDLMW